MSDEITWIGHSTVRFDLDDVRVLTDPMLTRRAAHLRRRQAMPKPELADVDLVLVSHVHMDHLHVPSLRRVRPGARVLVPTGGSSLVRKAGLLDVTEVGIGDRIEHGPLTVEVVPAAHRSGRGPHTRISSPAVGYVIDTGSARYYFAGDTDLFPQMADLGDVDAALLPIWGWGPTIGHGHLDPARATAASGLIRPGLVIPMHWGTYAPEDGRRRLPTWFDAPAERFRDAMHDDGQADRLRIVEPGESVLVGTG